jgi:quinol monooxygenase YgiN
MPISRRTFFGYLAITAASPFVAHAKEESGMYGLIAKLTVIPGRRDEMIGILRESASALPGCLSYVIAKDCGDENAVWVTEVWESIADHDASVSLPSVKSAMSRARGIISNFNKIAVTNPVWGSQLQLAHTN